MRDSKNLLLLLVSVGLMGTWIYHLYDKSRYSNHLAQVLVKDTVATQEAVRDSLQKLFTENTKQLDTTKSLTDSLKGSLDSTMSKIFELRRQISNILKNRNATNTDLKKARELIAEYQERIEEMKAQNTDLETERTRLNGVLTQLNDEMKGLQDNIDKITLENKALNATIDEASTFIASDMRLSIVTTKSGDKETEVTSAKKANKLIFSFTLQNNIASTAPYDVFVVILQPDNKVLQTDVWGADHFDTKTEGAKAYTTKVHFEYNKGERKKILYTIQPDSFLSGMYTMKVYQNGVSLGETTKQLN
jgi:division protein CdvB (Snf7/Vps24/ESCRT-III family)